MAITLIPAVARSGTAPRFLLDFRHPAVKEVMRLSTWTFGYVIANQISLLVITVVALRQFSDYSAYTSMYLLLQLPHGLLAVTLMTTYTPRLTLAHVAGNNVLYRTLIRAGVRVLVGLLLPAAVLFVAAPSAASALTGNFSDLGSSPAVLRGFGVLGSGDGFGGIGVGVGRPAMTIGVGLVGVTRSAAQPADGEDEK